MNKSSINRLFIKHAKLVNCAFYKNFNKTNFNTLDNNRILELKNIASNLLEEESTTCNKHVNYVKKMKRLNRNPLKYNINNESEKYILFMLSVDPTFETLKIYGENHHLEPIKRKMIDFFGVYDPKLIKIENQFLRLFLSHKEKAKLIQDIEKRVFK